MTCELQCMSSMIAVSVAPCHEACAQLPMICPSFRFINFPEQPTVWREISVITAALRSDSQDKHAQFLRGERT